MHNAYDLCLAVADHIEAEPRRYDQRTWGENWDHRDTRKYPDAPPCGTSACRAGWMVGLHDGMNVLNTIIKLGDIGAIEYRAFQLLGVNDPSSGETTERDFRNSVDGLFNGGAISATGRTAAHAHAGAQGLREFAATWRERLAATRLPDQIDTTTLVREFRITYEGKYNG